MLRSIGAMGEAEILVLHAVDVEIPPVYYTAGVTSILQLDPDLNKRVEEKLREELGRHLEGFDVKYLVREGRAVDRIRETAEEEKIDLIIMGAAGSHGVGTFLFGSTTARVIQKAVCPVLIV
jgi:nucleotide-binding universal stress UspA family protein